MKKFTRMVVMVVMTGGLAGQAYAQPMAQPPPPSENAAVWYLTAQYFLSTDLDEQTKAIFDQWQSPDLLAAGRALERMKTPMGYLRQGAELEGCAWAVDFKIDGLYTLLPHLGMLRQCAKLLAVSAQLKLQANDVDGAAWDLLAIFRMSRHAAADGALISCLVQFSIEKVAILTSAKHLDRFGRDELIALSEQLGALPNRHTTRDALVSERMLGDWIRNQQDQEGVNAWLGAIGENPNEIQQMFVGLDPQAKAQRMAQVLDELDEYYVKLHVIFGLPADEFDPAIEAFEKDVEQSDNALVRALMPSGRSVRQAEFGAQASYAMLRAMIAYRLEGMDAFNRVLDPSSGEPFTFEASDDAVVITSQLIYRQEPLALTFPASCAVPLK